VLKSFTIKDGDGEPVFAGRAVMLQDLAEHLAAGGTPIAVRFVEAGNGVTFEPAIAAVGDASDRASDDDSDDAPFPTEAPPEEVAE
jgi:hypothetical protein